MIFGTVSGSCRQIVGLTLWRTAQAQQGNQERQDRPAAEFKRLLAYDGLSDNVYKVAEKSLQQ